jgi:superfamily I DNA/RNA helicase
MELTEQQTSVVKAWEEGSVCVDAVAGSGKTTTLIAANERVRGPFMATTFTKSATDNLEMKLAQAGIHTGTVGTMNKLGFDILRANAKNKLSVDTWKYWNIARMVARPQISRMGFDQAQEYLRNLVDLTHYAMTTLTSYRDTPAMLRMAKSYSLSEDESLFPMVTEMIEKGMDTIEDTVHFDDQLFAPWYLNLFPEQRFPRVYLDEAQNLSAAQIDVALRYLEPDGLLYVTGDRNQAIMNFAGATGALDYISHLHQGFTELNLTTSFRFGQKIADTVRKIVEMVGANANSRDIVKRENVLPRESENTAIIARHNNELVSLAMEMMQANIPARLMARGIGKAITDFIQKATAGRSSITDAHATITAYGYQQMHKLESLGAAPYRVSEVESLMIAALRVLQVSKATSIASLIAEANQALNNQNGVTLITAHSAQSLEWDTVYVLVNGFSEARARSEEPIHQKNEDRVWYVALTRPVHDLFFVHNPEIPKQEESPILAELRELMKKHNINITDL